VEAAAPLRACAAFFLCDVHLCQPQLDALSAVLREVTSGELSEAEAIQRLERSPYGVGTAMDPESQWLLVSDVGTRTLEMAQRLGHQVVQPLAPDGVPLFLTDGLKAYGTAFLTHVGQWSQPARRRGKGPRPPPRGMPVPRWLSAQVVKSYRRRRIIGVKSRVVFGTRARGEQRRAACGWQLQTAFVERLHLDSRQRVAAVGRRVNTLCQGEDGLRPQRTVDHAYDNVCLPPASLRQPWRSPEPTNGRGSAKVWRPCTPAMATGVTAHVWSLQEVLRDRIPPWPQPAGA
jgi:hypothetical protein